MKASASALGIRITLMLSFMSDSFPELIPRFLLVQDRPVPAIVALVQTGGTANEVNEGIVPVDPDDLTAIAWLDYQRVFVQPGGAVPGCR